MSNRMEDERLKEKNIKDLEYNKILTNQSISLVIIGTSIITVMLSKEIPENIPKLSLILFLALVGILFLLSFSNKLEKKLEEIKNV